VKVKGRFGETSPAPFLAYLAYFIHTDGGDISSETSFDLQQATHHYNVDQCYSIFFVLIPPDEISLKFCTPKVVGV
jgi:hypothetical protein